MVWGVVEPSIFGDFFQGGDFVGWDETLSQYFERNMSPDEQALFGGRSAVYEAEVAYKFTEDRGFLSPHETPSKFQLRQARKTLGSLLFISQRLVVVEEQLKEIIEGADPGVHQFWPLHIVTPKGDPIPTRYFGMVIRRFIDSLIPEQSKVHQVAEGDDVYFADGHTKKDYGAITLSKDRTNGAPLWREEILRNPSIFLSDDLHEKIAAADLRMPKQYKVRII